jgi:hypothetical protein
MGFVFEILHRVMNDIKHCECKKVIKSHTCVSQWNYNNEFGVSNILFTNLTRV